MKLGWARRQKAVPYDGYAGASSSRSGYRAPFASPATSSSSVPRPPTCPSRRLAIATALVVTVMLAAAGLGLFIISRPDHNARLALTPARTTTADPMMTTTPAPSPTVPPPPRALPVAPGAGELPQTSAFPRTNDAAFRHAMSDLWLAVTTGKASFARPAFFPLAAYQKLKAIAYPTGDWHDRLWADFALDVGAAHQVAGRGARLARVIVPTQYALWIPPGVCANSIGYWHVPGARVVYRQDGQERSIGIASLISWRGVWYVVHFGAVLRGAQTGIVDDPENGPGTPGPAGGC